MLAIETKKIPVKRISIDDFRKALLRGAKSLLSDDNRYKGSSKEISGRR